MGDGKDGLTAGAQCAPAPFLFPASPVQSRDFCFHPEIFKEGAAAPSLSFREKDSKGKGESRRRKLRIARFRLKPKARSLRCSSSSTKSKLLVDLTERP